MTATVPDTLTGQLGYVETARIIAGPNDRKEFDQVALEALATSIDRDGIAQPPTLRPLADGRYEIVAGERRIRAMRDVLGWDLVPAFVRDLDDAAASGLMLVENMVRVDLDPIEEGRAFSKRIADGATVADVAELVGVSQRTVRARIDLLRLGADAQHLCSSGNLALAHAAQLVGLDENRQNLALRALSAGDLGLPAFTAVCDRLRREQEAEPMFDAEAFWSVEEYVIHGETAAAETSTAKLSAMSGQMLTTAEVADLLGVKPASVRRYIHRGTFPQPDGHLGVTPWWSPDTVRAWERSRRGPGRPAKAAEQ